MNQQQTNAYERHYAREDTAQVNQAVLNAVQEVVGFSPLLDYEIELLKEALWSRGFALAPMDRHLVIHSGT